MIRGVITGDVINSTSIPIEQRQMLLDAISSTMYKIKRDVPLEYELFRGDSIQVVVANPEKTLLVGILLRAGVKSMTPKDSDIYWDIRTSIGIGEVEFQADSIRISDGEAFRISGRGLDAMDKTTLIAKTPWQDVNEELDVTIPFVDDIVCCWTSSQARVVFPALLKHYTRKEIAIILGQSAQNVSKLLITAKEKLIRNSTDRFSKIINSKNRQVC